MSFQWMLLIEGVEGNWRVLHRGEAQARGRGCISNCGMESFMYRNKALSLSEDKAHRVSAAHGQVMTRPTSPPTVVSFGHGQIFLGSRIKQDGVRA